MNGACRDEAGDWVTPPPDAGDGNPPPQLTEDGGPGTADRGTATPSAADSDDGRRLNPDLKNVLLLTTGDTAMD